MLDDEDFEFSDDDFAKDNQLTIIDDARRKILDNIEKGAAEAKLNLKYNEVANFQANLNIITRNMTALVSLDDIDENLPEEEIQEKIDDIIKMTTELTFTNIDSILKSEDDEAGDTEVETDSGDTDTTDW